MSKIFTAIFIVTMVLGSACGPDDPTVNPCENNGPCLNSGECSVNADGKAVCDCGKVDFIGSLCEKKKPKFDPSIYLAHAKVCPNDPDVEVKITSAKGSNEYLNGYSATVRTGTFDGCVWVVLTGNRGQNVPKPSGTGYFDSLHGLEVTAISADHPITDKLKLNKIQPVGKVKVLFHGHRGRVLLFDVVSGKFVELATTLVKTGVFALTPHLSSFFIISGKPELQVSANHVANGNAKVDFEVNDDGFSEAHLLTFALKENGTSLDCKVNDSLDCNVTLTGGLHTLTAEVNDGYQTTSKEVIVNVDLCANSTCESWQTCRESDGQCVGNNPCDPDPCNGHGTCNPADGTCTTCQTGYTGSTCNTCATGYTGYPNCVVDKCYQNTCSGHGTCNASDGSCSCTTGYTGPTCNTCDTGFGPAYPTCNPVPTISGLAIDCSSGAGYCWAQAHTYPVSFSSANASTWSATVQIIGIDRCGGTGTPGTFSPSSGTVSGNPTIFSHTTGICTQNMIRITVTVVGKGGKASSSIDFKIW